jgi:acetyl-CoA carboxylase/biotin carboxylase 1
MLRKRISNIARYLGLQASSGGGGKGIRRCHSDEDVRLCFKQVIGEVPGSPVFTMKLAPQSRHTKVQPVL